MTDFHQQQQLQLAWWAWQEGRITPANLVRGLQAWIENQDRFIVDIFAEQQSLQPSDLELLRAQSLPSEIAVSESTDAPIDPGQTLSLAAGMATPAGLGRTPAHSPSAKLPGGDPTRFRILKSHAQGGLGEVFLARDEDLGRDVALKEIRADRQHFEEARERFIREAKITGQLEHPGIVPVYGFGCHADGRPYYAMRFVQGESLKAALTEFHHLRKRNTRLAGDWLVEFRRLLGRFITVCQAVHYAHSRGVVHRDLKPDNIMLGKHGETLVVDWGLAKSLGESGVIATNRVTSPLLPSSDSGETVDGFALGTPEYMSPEQAAGRVSELGPATDIYALGATLYTLLTGRQPFNRQSTPDILRVIQQGTFSRPRQHWRHIPRPLEAICLRAMQLKPANRYQTAAELAQDCERYLADEPIRGARESLFAYAGRWLKRHQRIATALLLSGLLVPFLLYIGFVLVQGQRHRAESAENQTAWMEHATRCSEAQRGLNSGDLRAVEVALRSIPNHQRGWETDYLQTQLPGLRSAPAFYEWRDVDNWLNREPIDELFFSATGPQANRPVAIAIGYDYMIAWDVLARRQLHRWFLEKKKHELPASQAPVLALNADGRLLVLAQGDQLAIYESTNSLPTRRVTTQGHVRQIVFSPAGTLAAVRTKVEVSGKEKAQLTVYNVSDWSALWTTSKLPARGLVFSRDGAQLILHDSARLAIVDAQAGFVKHDVGLVVPVSNPKENAVEETKSASISAVAEAADGKSLLIGSATGHLATFNLTTGVQDPARKLTEFDNVAVAFPLESAPFRIAQIVPLPNSSCVLITSSVGDIWVVDPHQRRIELSWTYHSLDRVAQSPDLAQIALLRRTSGYYRRFEVALTSASLWPRKPRHTMHAPSTRRAVSISPNADRLLFAGYSATDQEQRLQLLDVDTGEVRWTAPHAGERYTAFSPDGNQVVALGSELRVLDAATGKILTANESLSEFANQIYPTSNWPPRNITVTHAQFNQVGDALILNGTEISIWNPLDSKPLLRWKTGSWGNNGSHVPHLQGGPFALSADGAYLMTVVDFTLYKLSVPDLKVLAKTETESRLGDAAGELTIAGILANGDAVLERHGVYEVTGSRDGALQCTLGHDGRVTCLALHPAGDRIATGGDDGIVNIWQVPTGVKLLSLKPGREPIQRLRFAASGKRLVAVDVQGSVMIWE